MKNTEIIYEKVNNARMQRLRNNCYSMDVVEHSQELWEKGDEFLLSYDDNGINRLIYFAKDYDSVDSLLNLVKNGRYYLEFMAKNPTEYIPSGSRRIAAMMRMTNSDCRSVFEKTSPIITYKDSVVIDNAAEYDAEEINRILWTHFRTEISHLLSDEELREKIKDGQLTVHRNIDGHIDALLQANVMPKKFYINQIVNKTEKNVIHAILLDRLEKYVNAGGKYLYAWVEDTNIASLKFHEKYGMKHDGMWSMIYSLER